MGRFARTIVVLVLAACEHPGIDGAMHIDGVYVDVEHDPALPICAASVERADRFVTAVAAMLDTAVADIDVHLYEGATGCDEVAGHATDCASGSEVWASSWVQYHELVHVVARPLGAPPAFLLEGLADALGDPVPLLGADERRTAALPLDSVAFYAGDPESAYRGARDFTVYLLARYGMAPYRALYRGLLGPADPVTVRAAFARVFDADLDDVIAAWRSWAPDATATSLLPLATLACAAPVAAPVAADRWSIEESTCVETLRLAQRAEHRVELGTAGLHAVTARVEAIEDPSWNVAVDVGGCEASEPDAHVSLVAMRPAHTELAWIDAGSRVVAQRQSGSATPRVASIEIARIGDAGATCAAAPVFEAPASWDVRYARPPADWPGTAIDPELGPVRAAWIRIDLPTGPPRGLVAGVTGPAKLRLCQGSCSAPTNCQLIRADDGLVTWQPLAGSPIWLRAHAVPGPEPIVVAVATE